MASIQSPLCVPPTAVFLRDPPEVLKATKRLERLTEIDKRLVLSARSRTLDRLVKIWEPECEGETWKNAVKRIISSFKRLGVFPALATQLESIKDDQDFRQVATRCQKDAQSLSTAPLRKSQAGVCGPTFLVNFPRWTKRKGAFAESYVLKWTDWNEAFCNELYNAVSTGFSSTRPYTFLVPKATVVDLERGIHRMTGRGICNLTMEMREEFDRTLQNIVTIQDPSLQPEKKQVLFMEMIRGENLLDFALNKYNKLGLQQKEKLFSRLGRLSALDLVLGNLDRLVQVSEDRSGNYSLRPLESNLGNIMIFYNPDDSESFPDVFAIDNGIDPDLITNEMQIANYCTFLKEELKSPAFAERMTANIIESMRPALHLQIEDLDEANVEVAKQNITLFYQDLEKIAPTPLKKGITQMIRHLESNIISKWNSDESASLREDMSSLYPELLSSIEERLAIFQSNMQE